MQVAKCIKSHTHAARYGLNVNQMSAAAISKGILPKARIASCLTFQLPSNRFVCFCEVVARKYCILYSNFYNTGSRLYSVLRKGLACCLLERTSAQLTHHIPTTTILRTKDKMASTLINSLRDTLKDLHSNPYPEVSNPNGCKKRASVALVLRIRANHDWQETHTSQDDSPSPTTPARLDQFFSQTWVQHGDPECVFIKRAARVGDRWTSHVALPGGKRGTVP
jgi:hypothetical protein